MTSSIPAKKNLDLPPGHWQIFSYGRLTALPTAKQAIWIRASFRRVIVDSSGDITEWTEEIVHRDVPVGELVAWEIGCVFDPQTRKVSQPQPICEKMSVTEVQVAFTDESCSVLRRYHRDEHHHLIFKNRRLLPEDPEANIYFLQANRPGLSPLLIPCTTVLQTFWGRSSNLIHMLLDSRFQDFDRYVLNVEKRLLNQEDAHAYIWLRQWSLDDDARFLATLAFDEGAIRRGQRISLELQAAMEPSSGKPVRCVNAWPPHSDFVTLKVLGGEFNTPAGPFFYVQNVLSSSYKPPFSKLSFDRDNDNRAGKTGEGEEEGHAVKSRKAINREQIERIAKAEATEFELDQQHPSYQTTIDSAIVGRFGSIFPGISSIEAEKLDQLETKYENVAELKEVKNRRWRSLSTLPGVAGAPADVVGTTLSSGHARFDPQDESLDPIGPPLDVLIQQVIEYMSSGPRMSLPQGIGHIDIAPIFPWQRSLVLDGLWVFSLPIEHRDYPWAWLYRDPYSRFRKRGLCLRITYFSEVGTIVGAGYLVELEGRNLKSRLKPKQGIRINPPPDTPVKDNEVDSPNRRDRPVLFIWQKSEQNISISDEHLRDLIIGLAQEGGTSASAAATRREIQCYVRKHSSAEFSQLLRELLERVLGR